MSGYLLDTNSVIYLFDGEEAVAALVGQTDNPIFISCITKIELLCFDTDDQETLNAIAEFLRAVSIVYIDDEIIDSAILCRKQHKLKIPDAIIAATAQSKGLTLVTADKAFRKISGMEIISPL